MVNYVKEYVAHGVGVVFAFAVYVGKGIIKVNGIKYIKDVFVILTV